MNTHIHVKCSLRIAGLASPRGRPLLRPHSRRWVTKAPIRQLLTLAIETSCDDTAVAIVEKTGRAARLHFNQKITSNNSKFGGIHPLVSLESHQQNVANLIYEATKALPDVESPDGKVEDGQRIQKKPDFISVTRGPGMRNHLQTGIDTAKGLAVAWQVPIVGVHHMQAHALTPRLVSSLSKDHSGNPSPEFPFLSLLVSGGHTLLLQSEDLVTHRVLADTDIAIGDCLDKVARAVLPSSIIQNETSVAYGALLEEFAFGGPVEDPADYDYRPPKNRHEEITRSSTASPFGWPFALPFTAGKAGAKIKSLEFSFTGISSYASQLAERGWNHSTNALSQTNRDVPMGEDEARYLARETMRVAFEHLATRLVLALEQEAAANRPKPKTLVIAGGVSANKYLLHTLKSFLAARGYQDIEILAPPIEFCTDNAAMIGWAGIEMYEAGYRSYMHVRSLRRWSLENILTPEEEEEYSGAIYEAIRKDSTGKAREEWQQMKEKGLGSKSDRIKSLQQLAKREEAWCN